MLKFNVIVDKEESDNFQTMLKQNYEEIYQENNSKLKNKVTDSLNKILKIPKSMIFNSIERTEEDIEELFGDNPKFGTVGFEILKENKSIGYILLDIGMDKNNISHGSIYSFYIKPEERKEFFQNDENINELNNFVDNYFAKLGISNIEYNLPTVMLSDDLADAMNKMGYKSKPMMNLDEIPFEKGLDLKKTNELQIGK